MKLTRRTDTAESRRYWASIDQVAKEVESWPAWKRGEPESSARQPRAGRAVATSTNKKR
ncbi:MAG: hypothetical protein SF182_07405 [Deltaproteobacteria bacterium]|nr:hypothetical protein [Deltaproteobacteria bacterium]